MIRMQAAIVGPALALVALAGCPGASPVVQFEDPLVEQEVRITIGMPNGDIRREDLVGVGFDELSLNGDALQSLEGIQFCTDLVVLELNDTGVEDIGPVAGLLNLQVFFASDHQITDLRPLRNLPLIEIELANNGITDVGPLGDIQSLRDLDLSDNPIGDILDLADLSEIEFLDLGNTALTDLGPLAELTTLIGLGLDETPLGDLSPLSSLTNLDNLSINDTGISDLSFLTPLVALTALGITGNEITDIGPLQGLTNLSFLSMASNQIVDLAPLVDNPGIGDGDFVNVRDNPLGSEAFDSQIPALQARGVSVSD